jgi:hypothetical protein
VDGAVCELTSGSTSSQKQMCGLIELLMIAARRFEPRRPPHDPASAPITG